MRRRAVRHAVPPAPARRRVPLVSRTRRRRSATRTARSPRGSAPRPTSTSASAPRTRCASSSRRARVRRTRSTRRSRCSAWPTSRRAPRRLVRRARVRRGRRSRRSRSRTRIRTGALRARVPAALPDARGRSRRVVAATGSPLRIDRITPEMYDVDRGSRAAPARAVAGPARDPVRAAGRRGRALRRVAAGDLREQPRLHRRGRTARDAASRSARRSRSATRAVRAPA